MFRLALVALLLCIASPALAAGRWVRQCNGTSCQMVWQEDSPRSVLVKPAASCACQECQCTSQANCGCSLRAVPRLRGGSVAAPRAAASGWYLGKRFDEARQRRQSRKGGCCQ